MRKTLLALLFSVAAAGAGQQPWDPADLWKWRTVSDPRIRPDGQWVVYVEGWSGRAADASYSNLWAVSTDGKKRVRITDGEWRDWSPRWSPDGSRVAWIRERSSGVELRVGRVEAHQESHEESRRESMIASGPIERFAWSPDGKWIAFTARVASQAATPAWTPADILPLLRPVAPERMRWFVASVEGGVARRIPAGDLEAAGEPAWMPDGQSISSAAADGGIYSIRVADGSARRLTKGAGHNQDPVIAPDGARIAFLATDSRPRSYSIRKLMVMNPDGSGAKVLGGTLDRDATDPQWSSDSRTVYFIADDRGSTHVYAGRNDGSTRQATSAAERLRGFTLADNGRAVSVRSTAARAEEVVTFAVDVAPAPVVLAAPNEALIAERQAGVAQEIAFPSGGKTIQGWVIRPPGFDASQPYPLLLDIADAPRRMWGVEFSPRAQIYAARGYVTLRINPRGTPGYGEEFGYLLPTRFPGDDADDLLCGVDFMAAQGWINARHMAVKGGLLAAWLIGHSDRFKAAVAVHPIVDWTLDVATSSGGARHAADWMNALPWEDPDQYVKHSPIYFAQNFKTPTLILARDPDPQSDELYFALRARQVDCALVRIADDRKPGARAIEMEATLAWLKRMTGAP
ncbi:MAG: prolyl oligopeptidase family serine peptidase [Bryobacteraceae bacterium]